MIPNIVEMVNSFSLSDVSSEMRDLSRSLLGMSSCGNMQLLNNAVKLMDEDSFYLEVGTWKGKTLIAASLDNPHRCIAVDNFSQGFGIHNSGEEIRQGFLAQIEPFKSRINIQLLEGDYLDMFERHVIPEQSVEVYLYDGHHAEEHQYKGIKEAVKFLKDDAIIFVDDSSGGSREDVFNAHNRLVNSGLNLEIIRHFEYPHGVDGFWSGILVVRFRRES
jgi:hypothetical protein